MNNIKIYEDIKAKKMMFEYKGNKHELNFINLKEFSKEILKLDNIKEYNPVIDVDSKFTLYETTLKSLIESVKGDDDLIKLFKEHKEESNE